LLDTLTVTTRKINTTDVARTTSATAMAYADLHVVIQNDGQHGLGVMPGRGGCVRRR